MIVFPILSGIIETLHSCISVADFFRLSSHSPASFSQASLKAEHGDFDMKRDFSEIVNCKQWTARKIFDGDLQ